MKRYLTTGMRAELRVWQLGSGLLGGWWALVIALAALIYGWVALANAAMQPVPVYQTAAAVAETAGTIASVSFVGAILAIVLVLRESSRHALLRLSPNVQPMVVAINVRLALYAVLSLPPAIILRALIAVKHSYELNAVIALADISTQGYLTVTLKLVYVAALIVITFGWLRVPTRFAFLPLFWGIMPWSRPVFMWLPLVACVVIVVGHRLWLRSDRAAPLTVRAAKPQQRPSLIERFATWRLRRAARGMGDRSSAHRVTALLTTQRSSLFTFITVLAAAVHIAIAPAVFDSFVGGWVFAYMVVALLATPTPIPLGQVMLLPLGAERHNVGRILMSVWVRDMRFRLLLGVVLGLLLRALCWWLDLWSFLRPPFAENGDELMLLVWKPLMTAVGLYGAAYALCWTISASPRLLTKPGTLAALPMVVIAGFAALGAAIGWLLGQAVPALNSRDMSALRFAIVNGAMLPLLAWWVNRQLRPEWLHANLGAISVAMQVWAARRGKSRSAL